MQAMPGGSGFMLQLVRSSMTELGGTFVPATGDCSVTRSSSAVDHSFSGGGLLETRSVPANFHLRPSLARSSCVGRYCFPIRFGTSTWVAEASSAALLD